MSKKLALCISFIFNPLIFMLPVPYLAVYRDTRDSLYALKWELVSLPYIAIVGLFLLYGLRRHIFSDMDVSVRQERNLFFLFSGVVAFLYLYFLLLFKSPLNLFIIACGMALGIILFSFVNLLIKASGHVAVVSAFAISVAMVYGGWFLLTLLLIPLVAWSRITLRRHTVPEILVGGVLGAFLVGLTYVVVRYVLPYL